MAQVEATEDHFRLLIALVLTVIPCILPLSNAFSKRKYSRFMYFAMKITHITYMKALAFAMF